MALKDEIAGIHTQLDQLLERMTTLKALALADEKTKLGDKQKA